TSWPSARCRPPPASAHISEYFLPSKESEPGWMVYCPGSFGKPLFPFPQALAKNVSSTASKSPRARRAGSDLLRIDMETSLRPGRASGGLELGRLKYTADSCFGF